MSYNELLSYGYSLISWLNEHLADPVKNLQNRISLKFDSLPNILKVPLNFVILLLFVIFVVISYTGDFICNLVGIVYPLFYSIYLFDEIFADNDNLRTMNKYWLLFGSLTTVDMLCGYLLNFIPGYPYFKLSIIYALVRNDFAMTDIAFSYLQNYVLLSLTQYISNNRPKKNNYLQNMSRNTNNFMGSDNSSEDDSLNSKKIL